METIVYAALLSGKYGYSDASRDYCKAFEALAPKLGFRLEKVDVGTQAGVLGLINGDWTGKHLIIHKMPGQFRKEMMDQFRKAKSFTYMTVWECTMIPPNWIAELEQADTLVTFSDFSASGFRNTFDRMKKKLPEMVIIPHFLRPFEPDVVEDFNPLIDERHNILFTASQLTERKGVDLLIKSFWAVENAEASKLRLIIKCPTGTQKYCDAVLPKNDRPDIVVIEDYLTNAQMDYLMSICPSFISTARGEGFGLDVVRAGNAGIDTYSTEGSAPDSWLEPCDTYHTIRSDLEPVVSVSTYSFANTRGMRWPVPRMSGIIETFNQISKSVPVKFTIDEANRKINAFNEGTTKLVTQLLERILA